MPSRRHASWPRKSVAPREEKSRKTAEDDKNPRTAARNCTSPAGCRLGTRRAVRGSESRRRAVSRPVRTASMDSSCRPSRVQHEVAIGETITVAELAQRMAVKSSEVIKTMLNMGVMATINQPVDQDTAVLVVEEMGHVAKMLKADQVEEALQAGMETSDEVAAAPAGRDDHGPRRPRQDIAARLHPPHQGRGGRGGRHHAAHRRLPCRDAARRDHVPRHAGPRGIHRDARARRPGHGHRRAGRRCRRRRHAADEGSDPARQGGQCADRRRGQQDRQARCRSGKGPQRTCRQESGDRGGVGRREHLRAGVGEDRATASTRLLESILLQAEVLELKAVRDAPADRRRARGERRAWPRRRRDGTRQAWHPEGRRLDRRRRAVRPRARAVRRTRQRNRFRRSFHPDADARARRARPMPATSCSSSTTSARRAKWPCIARASSATCGWPSRQARRSRTHSRRWARMQGHRQPVDQDGRSGLGRGAARGTHQAFDERSLRQGDLERRRRTDRVRRDAGGRLEGADRRLQHSRGCRGA